jgi:membrane protease subunit HflK
MSFEDAIKAREDEQRLKNEAESYANEVVPKARGTAARMMEESEAYRQRAISKAEGEASRFKQLLTEYEKAPEVTRERMYLDAMQDIFEQTDTIVMDVKGSSNVVYLPLDKVKRQPASAPVHSAKEVETPVTGVTSQDVAEIVNRSQRTGGGRGREGRGQ